MDNGSATLKCEAVNDHNLSDRCRFVRNLSDCQSSDGFLNYVYIEFCDFEGQIVEPMLVFALWLIFLFIVLGITTDNFFCPALSVISKSMRLSDNVAGVTLLAFGNGAPDIFSSLAAVTQDRSEFVIGGLFGAGIFVTCTVAGSIMIVTPFKIDGRPFLRDIIFYLAATYWAFYVFYRQEVRLLDALGFLGLYLVYIFTVVGLPKICKIISPHHGKKSVAKVPAEDSSTESAMDNSEIDSTPSQSNYDSLAAVASNADEPTYSDHVLPINDVNYDGAIDESTPLLALHHRHLHRNATTDFLHAVSPIDLNLYKKSTRFMKAFLVIQSPAVLCLRLTIPVIDYDNDKHNWNRILNALHCVIGPLFVVFAINKPFIGIGVLPVWGLVLLVGVLLAALVYFTSTNDNPPKYHLIFSYLGFGISVVWIYTIANEIVNVLKAIGIALNISGAILGLTVLAWGNSISDLVANVAVAKKGAPMMGLSASIGGPLMNLLVGMGLPFTILTVGGTGVIPVTYDRTVEIMSIFLFISLMSTMVAMVALKFNANRRYGFYLIFLYLVFVATAALVTTGVI